MIIQTLHAFAVGVGFSIGVLVVAVLCQIATKSGRKNLNEDWQKGQDRIEQRLAGTLECHKQMVNALHSIAVDINRLSEKK